MGEAVVAPHKLTIATIQLTDAEVSSFFRIAVVDRPPETDPEANSPIPIPTLEDELGVGDEVVQYVGVQDNLGGELVAKLGAFQVPPAPMVVLLTLGQIKVKSLLVEKKYLTFATSDREVALSPVLEDFPTRR